jgi:hypothetical protein
MKPTFDKTTTPARSERKAYRIWIMTLHRGGETMDLHLSGTFAQAKADAMEEARSLDCEQVSLAGSAAADEQPARFLNAA